MVTNRLFHCLIYLLLTLACSPLKVGAQSRSIHKTAIQLSSYNLIFTKVRVNGREVLALIDSGSSRPLEISSHLAQELSIPLIEDKTRTIRGHDGKPFYLSRGRLQSFVIGDSEKKDIDIEVAGEHLVDIAKQVNTTVEVLIGWGFLSRGYVVIDYPHLTLELSDQPMETGGGDLHLGYSVVNNVPIVRGAMDDGEINLLFDTGAPMSNIDASYVQVEIGGKVTKETVLGNHKVSLEWRVKDLSVIKGSLGCTGVIGNNFLSRYRLYFDTKNKVVYFS
ncbi:MAG TPA: retropepsin-like aspartic protease [Pyrinomonadaceae bacterium]|nr:retropepsin-like aspartic protease [Pyrinomonadaceae bacterium]